MIDLRLNFNLSVSIVDKEKNLHFNTLIYFLIAVFLCLLCSIHEFVFTLKSPIVQLVSIWITLCEPCFYMQMYVKPRKNQKSILINGYTRACHNIDSDWLSGEHWENVSHHTKSYICLHNKIKPNYVAILGKTFF